MDTAYSDYYQQDLLVCGYFRKMYPYENRRIEYIPQKAYRSCIRFYYSLEYFWKIGSGIRTQRNQKMTMTHCGYEYNTIYGYLEITKDCEYVYQWTFKIRRNPEYCYSFKQKKQKQKQKKSNIFIGIDASNRQYINCNFAHQKMRHSTVVAVKGLNGNDGNTSLTIHPLIPFPQFYAYASNGKKYCHKRSSDNHKIGMKFANKISIVTMELDGTAKTLKYVINGKDTGIVFDAISFRRNEIYNMAISVGSCLCVQMIGFEKKMQTIKVDLPRSV